jgi:hypothetical protein
MAPIAFFSLISHGGLPLAYRQRILSCSKYLTETDLAGERGEWIGDCGMYRYRLWREWDKSLPTQAFLMLNPSLADHQIDDPTITRCLGRAVASNFVRLEVSNLSRCAQRIPTSC